jgi:hypothetical protein
VPVPHEQVQLHARNRGLQRRAGPHGLGLPHRAPGGRVRRRPQVLDPAAGEFVPVDPVAGSFVVNIGDVGTVRILISRRRHHDEQSLTARACRSRFQAWSNGRLHNVKHRVQCVAPVPRISIAMFLLAPKDNRVSAPETRAGSRSSTTKTTGSCGCPPMSAPARRSHGWRRETFAPLADMEPNCVHVDTQLLYAKHRD